MVAKEVVTFEKAIAELKTSADSLKNNQLPLEDAIKAYEGGIKAYKVCKEILDSAKQRIETISE